MLTFAELLTQSKARISDPEKWTRNAFARDRYDLDVGAHSSRACKWCAEGSVIATYYQNAGGFDVPIHPIQGMMAYLGREARHILKDATMEDSHAVAMLNDHHGDGHDAVMSMFDSAIEAANRTSS